MPRGQYVRRAESSATPEPQSADLAEAPLSQRAQETRRDRRRRDDANLDRMYSFKLSVPREIEQAMKREGKVWRWFLDEPGRVSTAYANDWDIVEGVDPVSAGSQDSSKLVLYCKYGDWHEKDEAVERQADTEREEAMKQGRISSPRSAEDGETEEGSASTRYVPKGHVNRIS